MLNTTARILVVDDNPVNCEICKEILEEQFTLKIVHNGEDALASIAEFQPDLILLDVMMDGIDGLEVCRRLRSSTCSWVKIIMVSAKVQVDDRIHGYEAGADDYITKPFDSEELLAKVQVHLRMKHVEVLDDVKCRLLQVLQHGNRTPMKQILTNADLLCSMQQTVSEQERREAAETVRTGAKRLHEWLASGELLIALMTRYHKPEYNKVQLESCVADVIQKIEDRNVALAARIRVTCEPNITVECEPVLLNLLLDRLLMDALACAQEDSVVNLLVESIDVGSVRISVNRGTDSLDPQLLGLVFEPFGLPDEILNDCGDGMSLTMVREITRLHGGLVRAKNVPSGGVEIHAELPQLQPHPPKLAEYEETSRPS